MCSYECRGQWLFRFIGALINTLKAKHILAFFDANRCIKNLGITEMTPFRQMTRGKWFVHRPRKIDRVIDDPISMMQGGKRVGNTGHGIDKNTPLRQGIVSHEKHKGSRDRKRNEPNASGNDDDDDDHRNEPRRWCHLDQNQSDRSEGPKQTSDSQHRSIPVSLSPFLSLSHTNPNNPSIHPSIHQSKTCDIQDIGTKYHVDGMQPPHDGARPATPL